MGGRRADRQADLYRRLHRARAAGAARRGRRVARRTAGRPVKLVWTREEEFTWAYFRPAGVIDVASGVQADGTLIAWEFCNWNSGAAAMRTPYAVPNQSITFQPALAPL